MGDASGSDKQLARELAELANRGYRRAFQKVEKSEPLKLTKFFEIIESLYRGWSDGTTEDKKVETIKNVLNMAIDGYMLNRTLWNISIIRAVKVLYELVDIDLDSLERHKDKSGYSQRVAVVLDEAGLLDSSGKAILSHSYRDLTGQVRGELAKALRRLVAAQKIPDAQKQISSVGSVSGRAFYVPRPAYERAFHDLLESGARLIAIVGEAGNGKSRFAVEMISQNLVLGETIAILRAGQPEQLITDMAAVLARAEIHVAHLASDAITRTFTAHLQSPTAPTYILIDSLEDQGTLDSLAHPQNVSRIIVTSRQNLLRADEGKILVVKEMETEEALALVARALPHASVEDASQLVAAVGARPLAIVHASALIGIDDVYSIKQFVADLAKNSATVMERSVSPVEDTLTYIYRKTIDQLFDNYRNRDAGRLLALLACVYNAEIPVELVRGALGNLQPSDDGIYSIDLRFAGALRELQRRFLVEADGEGLGIHRLTQSLIRGIFAETGQEKVASMALFREALQQNLEDFIAWMPHIIVIIGGLAWLDSVSLEQAGFPRGFVIVSNTASRLGLRTFAQSLHANFEKFFDWSWPLTDDMTMVYRNHLRHMFMEWEIDGNEYLSRLASLHIHALNLGIAQSDASAEIFEAMTSSGYPEPASIELLRNQESAINGMKSLWDLAEYKTLIGEALVAAGHYEVALEELSYALKAHEEMSILPSLSFVSGRVLRSIVECRLQMGSPAQDVFDAISFAYPPDDLAAQIFATASALAAKSKISIVGSSDHALARVHAALFLEQISVEIRDGELNDRSRTATHNLWRFFELSKSAYQVYKAACVPRQFGTLYHDLFLIGALSQVSEIADEAYRCSPSVGMPDAAIFTNIGTAKFNFLFDLKVETWEYLQSPIFWEKMVARAVDIFGSPYWYCEVMALSCVVDARQHRLRNATMKALEADFQSIGRLDRFEHLSVAIDNIDDQTEFAKSFSYLLAP